MSPLRVLRGLILGGAGGILGWFLIEALFNLSKYEQPGSAPPTLSPSVVALQGAVLGVTIGAFLGVSEGMGERLTRFRRSLLFFTLLGALGSYVGFYFAQALFAKLGGKTDPALIAPVEFFPQLVIRSLSWSVIGLFLGPVFGVPDMSPRRMWNGAIGGWLGGFLAGFVFQALSFTGAFGGIQLRFLGFSILGAAIGFFINLVAEAMKRVWVKVLVGRNEGREYTLDTHLAYVGRDELADVPVFLDPAVPKRMASFRQNGGRYALFPESTQIPILVNGAALTPGHVLRDGDAIQFGRVTLAYFEKATATGTTRPIDRVLLAAPTARGPVGGKVPIPSAPGVCEFCGQTRDAAGMCACSVPGAGTSGAAPGFDHLGSTPGIPGGAPAWGAPTSAMATAGGYGDPGPAYAATVAMPMDPGGGFDAAPVAGPRLSAVGGPHSGQVFPILTIEIGIGRDPAQDVPLPGDTAASRRHARVTYADGSYFLRDEGSSNGTFVNGARIQEQALCAGDTIRVGATQLRFEV